MNLLDTNQNNLQNMSIYWRLFSVVPWSDKIMWDSRKISINQNKKYIISTINYYPNYSKITYYKKPFYGIIPIKDIKEQFNRYFNSNDKYLNISPLLVNNYIDDLQYFLAPIYINRIDRFLIIGIFLLDNEIISNLNNIYMKNMVNYNVISLLNFNINRPKISLSEKIRNTLLKNDESKYTDESKYSVESKYTDSNYQKNIKKDIKYNLFKSLILDVKKSNIIIKFNSVNNKELNMKIKIGNNNEMKEVSRNIIELLTDINGYLPSLNIEFLI